MSEFYLGLTDEEVAAAHRILMLFEDYPFDAILLALLLRVLRETDETKAL